MVKLRKDNQKKTLNGFIETFMKYLRNNGPNDPFLQNEWDKFYENIEDILFQLKLKDNLRLHDKKTGGVLRGNISSRKDNQEVWTNHNTFSELSCIEEKLKSEIGYSRALFNNQLIKIRIKGKEEIKNLNLIAYESPLIRKKKEWLNDNISNNFAICDLIGLLNNSLFAIEVKINPEGYSTCLSHALVESFAYGYYLNCHSQDKNLLQLNQEIRLCMEHFRKISNIKLYDSYKVKYIVAAPRSYYYSYFHGEKKNKKWYNLRVNETIKIESILPKGNRSFPKFGGYLLIDKNSEDVVNQSNLDPQNCIPNFNSSLGIGLLYPDISTLINDLSKD